MSDPLTSGSVVLTTSWSAPIWLVGLQKLDVCTYGGTALCQFHTVAKNEWKPDAGVNFDANLFRSIPALDEVFASEGGVDGVRFMLGGTSACTVTFHAFAP